MEYFLLSLPAWQWHCSWDNLLLWWNKVFNRFVWSIFPYVFVKENNGCFSERRLVSFFGVCKYLYNLQSRLIPVVKFSSEEKLLQNRIKLHKIRDDYAKYTVNRILIKIINQMQYTTWIFTEYFALNYDKYPCHYKQKT